MELGPREMGTKSKAIIISLSPVWGLEQGSEKWKVIIPAIPQWLQVTGA